MKKTLLFMFVWFCLLTNYSNAQTATLTGGGTICIGPSVDLTIDFTGTAPFSFTYSDGTNVFTYPWLMTNSFILQVKPLVTTTYTLTAMTDAGGSGTVSGTGTVTVTNSITAPVVTSQVISTTDCGTSVVEFTSDNADCVWYKEPNGALQPLGSGLTYNAGLLRETKTVYARYPVGSCWSPMTPSTATITSIPFPATQDFVSVCGLGTTFTLTASATVPGSEIVWYDANKIPIHTGTSYSSYCDFATKKFYVAHRLLSDLCEGKMREILVTAVTAPTQTPPFIDGGSFARCGDGPLTYRVDLATSLYPEGSFAWFDENHNQIPGQFNSTYTVNGTEGTVKTVYAAYKLPLSGCIGNRDNAEGSWNVVPTTVPSSIVVDAYCGHSYLSIPATGNYRSNWYTTTNTFLGADGVHTGQMGKDSSFKVAFTEAYPFGWYTCQGPTTILTVPKNYVDPVVTSNYRCGPGTVTLSAPADPLIEYKWTSDPLYSFDMSIGPVYTTPSISATKDFYLSWKLTVYSSTGSPRICSYGNPKKVVTATVYNSTISISSDFSVCYGKPTTITSFGSGPGIRQWEESSDGISYISIPGATNAVFPIASVTETKYYRVVITNGPCQFISNVCKVTMNPLPTGINFTGLASDYCSNGGASVLTGIPSGGIFSGPGISGNSFTPSAAMVSSPPTIQYTYTDANGCANSNTHTTDVHALPVLSFSGLNPDYCNGSSPVTLSGTPIGGTFSGTGISGNVFTPNTLNAQDTYNIAYSYTDSYSCSNVASQSVTVYANPVVSITTTPLIYCQSSSGTIPLVANIMGGTFSLNGNVLTDLSKAVAGTFIIDYNYTDAHSCSASTNTSILINPAPAEPGLSVSSTNVCSYASGSVSGATIPGHTYTSSIPDGASKGYSTGGQGWFGFVLNYGNTSGYVSSTATSTATGCSTTKQIYVTVKPEVQPPMPTLTLPNNNPLCASAAVNVLVGTQPGFNYLLTEGTGIAQIGTRTFNNNVYTYPVTFSSGGEASFNIAAYNAVGCTTSTSNYLVITPSAPVSVVISTTTSGPWLLNGPRPTFQAIVTNGGSNPSYQWKVDDVNKGTNSPTYYKANLDLATRGHQGDRVKCVVTSNKSCAVNNPATSNVMEISCSNCKEGTEENESELSDSSSTQYAIAYPNPFSTEAEVMLLGGNEEETFELIIRNVHGVEIFRMKNVKGNQSVSIGKEFASGLYFVEMTNARISTILRIYKVK